MVPAAPTRTMEESAVKPRSRVVRAILLIAAFPALIAFQLFLLLALDVRGVTMVPVALVTWFIGPVLLIIGILMLIPHRWAVAPSTRAGRLSLRLVLAAFAFLVIFFAAAAARLGPDESEEFLDNLYLAIPISLVGACTVSAGAVAGYAVLFRRERSLLVIGALILGVLVVVFTAGELGGHEEPDSGASRRDGSGGAAGAAV